LNTSFDVVVIGAGAAGENAAAGAAGHGLQTAIVEAGLVGGECSYWACIPSKTLLRPGKVAESTANTPGVSAATVDPTSTLAWRDEMVGNWDDSSQVAWLEGAGVELFRGHARLVGERTVQVTTADTPPVRLDATRAVVIATGSQPRHPDIPGLDEVGIWDSRDITSAGSVPERLLIIGGGTVGVEMAQAWAWLGANVTLIHNSGYLLASEEPFAGRELQAALEDIGVEVVTNGQTRRLRRENSRVVATVAISGDEPIDIEADEVLVATGRRARTDELGLETVGLEAGTSLPTNDHMQVEGVSDGWLYAVGDVNGRSLLTHVGKYQARIAADHIGGVAGASLTGIEATPRVVFTSPEISAVGLTEARARDRGISVDTVTHDIGKVAGATTLGKGITGTVKLVIDRDRQVVVGATFVGPNTGELLHAATIAVVAEVPLHSLWHAVPSFPTLSEVWLRLLENYRSDGWNPYPADRAESA
jgi:pyruvate/2-oxoglutarate dehydrogenase complex dihydrolipoamide dehydrogenase (E3) component